MDPSLTVNSMLATALVAALANILVYFVAYLIYKFAFEGKKVQGISGKQIVSNKSS